MAKIKTPGELSAALHRENGALIGNIDKLEQFLAAEETQELLTTDQFELAKRQLEIMRDYSSVLTKRIALIREV